MPPDPQITIWTTFLWIIFLIHKKQHCQDELLRLNKPESNYALLRHDERHAKLTQADLNGDLDTGARSLAAGSVVIELGSGTRQKTSASTGSNAFTPRTPQVLSTAPAVPRLKTHIQHNPIREDVIWRRKKMNEPKGVKLDPCVCGTPCGSMQLIPPVEPTTVLISGR